MNHNREIKTIPVPQKIFDSMIEVYQKWEKFSNEFEDFLLSSDREFIEKMRQARKEHLEGNVRILQSLKRGLN